MAGEKTKYASAKEIITLNIADAVSKSLQEGKDCNIEQIAKNNIRSTRLNNRKIL